MEHVYLGRQPILDKKGELVAYEILYRDSNKETNITNDRFASASVISSVLNKFGTGAILGHRPAFVKIDEKFLLHDIILSVPKEFFIFALFDSIEMNERVVERIQKIHENGYKVAINDIVINDDNMQKYKEVLNEISFIKINLDNNASLKIDTYISKLQAKNIKIIAAKIENNEDYILAKKLGCDMFQGYFFAKPNIIENAKYESSQMNVLRLYNMLITDTNIDEITKEFENNYEITVQLLRFINSASFSFRNRISSIHHILMLVGRIPLSQWLMLMIYSKSVSKSRSNSPLMLMVKNRTELMENILKIVNPHVKSNALGEAYFTGVLSLIDTLFGVELEDILEKMNISDDVKGALLHDEGVLGDIYGLIRNIELFNTKAIREFSVMYDIEPEKIGHIVLKSMENVNNFEDAMRA